MAEPAEIPGLRLWCCINDASGHPVAELSEYLGHRTNNYAEYQGLLAALRYATENQIKALKVIAIPN